MNPIFLKKIDAVVGAVATLLLPSMKKTELGKPRRLLVIRPGGIGDAVLVAPVLRALKEKYPEGEITVLAERRNAGAFALSTWVDKVYLYDDPRQLLRTVRAGYDLVIDTEQWHRLSAVVSRLTGAALSIGFSTNRRKRLFSHQVEYSHEKYEAWSFYDLLSPLGMEPPPALTVPFLSVPALADRRAGELLAASPNPSFVTIFPGASIAERRWGHDRFGELASRLALSGLSVVVVGGKEDLDEGDLIARGCGGLNLAGKTTLAETAAVIARSAALVSGDSGLLHIAVGLGVPTVSLFGPGIQAKWGPQGEGHLVLNKRLPCSPCTRFGTTPPCPIGAKCMADIGVDEVFAGITSMLQRQPYPNLRFPAIVG